MKKAFIITALLFFWATYHATAQHAKSTAKPAPSLQSVYQHAIMDAMYPDSNKISYNLLEVTPANKHIIHKQIKGEDYIKVITWKTGNWYTPDSNNTQQWEIWVTVLPELPDTMMREHMFDSLRIKQLLGLPQQSVYGYFIEFWVRPIDMFRPCPNNEITGNSCALCFSQTSQTDSSYIRWFNQARIDRYYTCGLPNQYPWTELGYTYDWAPQSKTHKGLSEFVIKTNKVIYRDSVYTNAEYFAKIKAQAAKATH